MIFVSYARQDQEHARRIVDALTQRGYDVWYDERSLVPGQKWRQAIEQAIRKSSVFLALLSHQSVSKRGFVQRELKAALAVLDEFPEDQTFLIPVRLDDCQVVDARLQELHYVDVFPDFDAGVEKVVQAIDAALKSRPRHFHPEQDAADIPRIIGVTVSPEKIIDGGEVRIRVQAASNAPVRWLNRTLDGPRGNIYGGGAATAFLNVATGLWEATWVERISRWAPSGPYRLSGISVRNEGERESAAAEAVTFFVENHAVSDKPVIEHVTLSSYRIPAGESIEVSVRARSDAPVNWLDKILNGPLGNLYGGGSGIRFIEEQPKIWIHRW